MNIGRFWHVIRDIFVLKIKGNLKNDKKFSKSSKILKVSKLLKNSR